VTWPRAEHTTELGERLEFDYCCSTFCAWPELLAALVERWRQQGISVEVRKCRRPRCD
jgi:hypothetical protein